MIINIRGTSGSGKSTIVRSIMSLYRSKNAVKIKGRKQPIGYLCPSDVQLDLPNLAIIGHYETPCGGCDTISKVEDTFHRVRSGADAGFNILFEGLLLSANVKWFQALKDDGYELHVIALDQVPIDECIESINARRLAKKGPDKFTPVNEKNTRTKHRGVELAMQKLAKGGVPVYSCNRETGLQKVKELLKL